MKAFMGPDFLLESGIARNLYEGTAKNLPICDYHSHLSPADIAGDKVFTDIGDLMLGADHYKWRLMRACGIQEEYITGTASCGEKFVRYAKALSEAPGNPLYHWTHMELSRYFSIHEPLTETNASRIRDEANRQMAGGDFRVKSLLASANVEFLATTDDPADPLDFHRIIAQDKSLKTKVVPTFRPDKLFSPLREDYLSYLHRFGREAKVAILDVDTFIEACRSRLRDFSLAGCTLADHGLYAIPGHIADKEQAQGIFSDIVSGQRVSLEQASAFEGFLLAFFAGEYNRLGWVMQLHLSAIRNQNVRRAKLLGPDCGTDSVGDVTKAVELNAFLNEANERGGLPKTILYSLNPASYYVIATAAGNFTGDIPGKVQLGPAWWFCDHRDGIKEQMRIFANTGALGTFGGMLTDSRSFLSFVRHDYFRRILCSLMGEWIEEGEYPHSGGSAEGLIRKICYDNPRSYFTRQNNEPIQGGAQP